MFDFTLKTYKNLILTIINNGIRIVPFKDFADNDSRRTIIIRHDIDARPEKSLEFARMEHSLGITTSYYFRVTESGEFDERYINEIVKLGHEIGYHYEDLYLAKGNCQLAIRNFEKNLTKLRELYPVQTICMDGHIFSKWNNLRLWDHYDYHQYGITGEPYLDLDFDSVLYLTDTGRKWNAVSISLYDKVKTRFKYNNKSTFDIISDLNANNLPETILLTVHPQRWHSDFFNWMIEVLVQKMKNPLRFLIVFVKRICNKT